MGRMYSVPFDGVTVSAVQDFFEIVSATGHPLVLHGVTVTVDTDETNQQLKTTVKRAASGYTSGSGGGTVTPVPLDPDVGASSATAERNNTSRASGTLALIHAEGWPSQGGFAYLPTPELRPKATPGQAFIIGLENAPAAGIAMSGVAYVEEL